MVTRSPTASPVTEGRSSVDVRVEGIRKTFGSGNAAALDGVDLSIREGELLALLGPSGSGKTTLLRVIAGLEIPDGGRVFFGTADVTDEPVQGRGIGFVFQHYALFRHLDVAENVAYGLRTRRHRRPETEIRARVAELLALVQLDGLGRRFPAQLSGGQRQRVALARALATTPRVLLLDEPFGALDAQVRKDLRRWLRDIHRRTGQTTIFVTHDQDEALELADRVAILNGGRLEQVGTPEDVYDRPESAFVMSFVGESARLPVRVRDGVAGFGGRALSLRLEGVPDGEHALHLRAGDLRVVDPGGPAELVGTVEGVRRVAGARRVEVQFQPGIAVEIDVAGPTPLPGERIGFTLTGGRVFP